jgi:hypothetical protein
MKKVLASLLVLCTILSISNIVSVTYANPTPDDTVIYTIGVSILQPKTNETYFTNNFVVEISVSDIPLIPSTQVQGYVWVGMDRNDSFAYLPISLFNVSNSIQQLNYSIPLTNIPNGNHSLTATVSYVQTPHLETNNPYIKNLALWGESKATNITVDAESPSNSSPTPTVQELSWLVIVPLFLSVLFIAVIIRHRKTPKLNE